MRLNLFELAYRYVFPSVRRRLVEIMYREFTMNQVDIAKKLGITQSSVSKYIDGKRGSLIELSKYLEVDEELRRLAKELVHMDLDQYTIQVRLAKITLLVLAKGYFCRYHAELDNSVDPGKCSICRQVLRNFFSNSFIL